MIYDQRHSFAPYLRQLFPDIPIGEHTQAQVVQVWERLLAEVRATRAVDVQLHDTGESAPAYVNHGRWVIDCGECGSGAVAWPDHDKACCLDCGAIYDVTFPDSDTRQKAEHVMSLRPLEATRNWFPDRETLGDLQAQNILMGEVPVDFGGIVDARTGQRVGANELLPDLDLHVRKPIAGARGVLADRVLLLEEQRYLELEAGSG